MVVPIEGQGRQVGLVALILVATAGEVNSAPSGPTAADDVSVTILSSNLADGATVGEWGFSALVEVDGRCVLFDAGRHPDTVLRNARALGIDLSCVSDVVLSHFHFDHTTGLVPLLRALRSQNPEAIRRVGSQRLLPTASRRENRRHRTQPDDCPTGHSRGCRCRGDRA